MSSSDLFAWVILPILIFLSRIADQSIGTLRLIFLSKGFKTIAPVLGFFEVIIWLLAVSQIMRHLDNFLCYIAYGAGFAMGNYIGIMLDEKLSIGNVLIRIIPKYNTDKLIEHLRSGNFGVTVVDAQGSRGDVKIIFTILQRKRVNEVVEAVNFYNPNAFFTIEDIKAVNEGIRGDIRRRSIFEALPGMLKKAK